jgi:hypothetical protein|nr:single-stranded DNA-binding protein [uncultured Oscillibacter sp.]
MNEPIRNDVRLEGLVPEPPVLSHENHGTRFFRCQLSVPRLSGQEDLLPVLLPEAMAARIQAGEPLRLRGQLRSFNNRSGVGSRLVLTVYAMELEEPTGEACNHIYLTGALCKPPTFRKTPLGRSICDLMLAVSRKYGRADYLPVIAWGQLALRTAKLQVGDPLALEGRIQSRPYQKLTDAGPETRIAYEVSMMHLLELPPENL